MPAISQYLAGVIKSFTVNYEYIRGQVWFTSVSVCICFLCSADCVICAKSSTWKVAVEEQRNV
jgi:hypothetical protein